MILGNTPLHLAVLNGQGSMATLLLQNYNVDPTVKNANGDTPLHLAAINGQVSIASIFLQQDGINLAVPNADGMAHCQKRGTFLLY